MKTLTVFDPALCCRSGVCGIDVDQALIDFSTDIPSQSKEPVGIENLRALTR